MLAKESFLPIFVLSAKICMGWLPLASHVLIPALWVELEFVSLPIAKSVAFLGSLTLVLLVVLWVLSVTPLCVIL